MPSANYGAVGRRATLATAIALSLTSIPAHAVLIDGSLTDLANAVTAAPYNAASATDPQGNADSPATENNNGFDIRNVYAFYDWPADVLYVGMNFYGTVGDSRPVTDTTSTNEYLSSCATGTGASAYCKRTVFDSNETYSIQLWNGTTTSSPSQQVLLYNVTGVNNGTDTVSSINNPYTLTVTHSVSEANNGVEFSIYGLYASGALPYFSFSNPANLLVRFGAGSGDPPANTGSVIDDYHLLQMQVVPAPAAAWLFGSGLVGLIAAARKRQKTA